MDEYDYGMEPGVKKYFRKIISSFSVGMLWLLATSTAGIYFQLGFVADGWQWYNVIFYSLAVLSLVLLIRYYYRLWKS